MEVVTTTTTNCLTKKRSRHQPPPQTLPRKRSRSQQPPQTPPWANLQTEHLEVIMEKLPFHDIPLFKFVCSSWRQAALTYSQSPLLMLPSPPPSLSIQHDHNEAEEESVGNKSSNFFYALKDKSVYEYKNVPDEFHESRCVGSSNGYLVLLDKDADPYLLNLFSRLIIKLPPKEKFPHIKSVCREPHDYNSVSIEYENDIFLIPHQSRIPFDDFRKTALIRKAVLSDNKDFVIIIYGHRLNLGYCRPSDSAWTHLQGINRPYSDILCSNNKLHALGCDGSLDVWDFSGSCPVKKIDIQPTLELSNYFPTDLYSTHDYLVESRGDVLLVVRYVGEFVRDGEPVFDPDLLTDEADQPLICPYRMLDFKVYKLDLEGKKWSGLESLGDRALFLGGNHSVSLTVEEHRELKGNSIYFSDTYWERMDEDYSYGGHDMGVYSLEDGSINPFIEIVDMKIEPPPFWVVPFTPSN